MNLRVTIFLGGSPLPLESVIVCGECLFVDVALCVLGFGCGCAFEDDDLLVLAGPLGRTLRLDVSGSGFLPEEGPAEPDGEEVCLGSASGSGFLGLLFGVLFAIEGAGAATEIVEVDVVATAGEGLGEGLGEETARPGAGELRTEDDLLEFPAAGRGERFEIVCILCLR